MWVSAKSEINSNSTFLYAATSCLFYAELSSSLSLQRRAYALVRFRFKKKKRLGWGSEKVTVWFRIPVFVATVMIGNGSTSREKMAVLVLPGVLKDIQWCDVWQPTSPPAHDVKAN